MKYCHLWQHGSRGYYVKQKSKWERQIPYNLTYTFCLKKNKNKGTSSQNKSWLREQTSGCKRGRGEVLNEIGEGNKLPILR